MRTHNDLTTGDQRLLEFVEQITVEGIEGHNNNALDCPVCLELVNLRPEPRVGFRLELSDRLNERIRRQHRSDLLNLGRKAVVPALILLLISFVLLTTPGGRAFAGTVFQDVSRFFTRAESDTITIIATATSSPTLENASTNSPPLIEGLDDLETRYSYGLDDVSTIANFAIREPTYLLPEFSFIGARYDQENNGVYLLYVFPNQAPTMDAVLTLAKFSGPFVESGFGQIGPETEVVTVMIGNIQAEYVEGGWLYVQDPSTPTSAPGETIVKEFHWERSAVPSQTLRWIANGFLYQINFVGSELSAGYLTLEDLIHIAETWK